MDTGIVDHNVVVIDDDPEPRLENEPEPEPESQPKSQPTVVANKAPQKPKPSRPPRKKKIFHGGYGPPGGGFGRNFGRPPQNFGPPPQNFGPPPPLFPPGPQGPPNFMWGRGFGPQGPPMRRQPVDDRMIKYLIRCGVARDNLKYLPHDLLQLMEPEYCGLCAQGFDSFATSRIHYISKNHIKSQKKWVNQQSDVGFRRVKEVAFKARDLYCELCDVHITSKSHSDSHYSGRPHRSIVEGRKNPKNPMLLQRGMEDRVIQLVRREKKFLKTLVDDVEVEKEVKITQPELFCDICKTSVTCSEQMTMHLNGKRHLNKEKQHILKMMKGETDKVAGESQEKNDEDMEEVGETEKETEEEPGVEKASFTDDKYDWGNGSSTWDELKDDDAY
ncbi:uncharacterized protein LOC120623232 isoform X2 [Pararge aegeria]|uniref:uncharacterized protein LOC120623232 isoform X2 n=1 Tax=Pararge aegeria TaxID=116150 RepID=UPI0019D0C6F6|nr:uncharacterized protein LOC120623232 isoform X2 [Pararge aegeria]